MLRLLAFLALASCSPAYRVAGRCPGLTPQALDFTATAGLLATSAVAYNDNRLALSLSAAALGMTIALAANAAECR